MGRTGPWAWFFVFYALWGFCTLGDYGVHLDEITQRTIGMENNRFLSGRVGFDKVEQHKFFGPIWESVSYLAEQVIFQEPIRSKLLLRRAMLWMVYLFALWRLFLLGLRNGGWGASSISIGSSFGEVNRVAENAMNGSLYRLRFGAMLPVLMVALWPRMFAEAHYNTKDALFFALMVFVVDGLDRVWRQKAGMEKLSAWGGLRRYKGWIGVMILLGVATTIRLSGVVVWGLAMGFDFFLRLDWRGQVQKYGRGLGDFYMGLRWRQALRALALGALAFAFGYIGSYPYLWFTGWQGMREILGFVVNNPWPNGALFFGSIEPSRWYLLGWMCVTLNGLILVPLILGFGLKVFQFLKVNLRIRSGDKAKSDADFLTKSTHSNPIVWLMATLLLVYLGYAFVKIPVMYDAWRHSLFLLLPVVILSARGWWMVQFIFGLTVIKKHTWAVKIWVVVTLFWIVDAAMVIAPISWIQVKNTFNSKHKLTEIGYPAAQTHFNILGKQWIGNFPMQVDYWHQTNYQALQWVLNQLPSGTSAIVIGEGESLMLNAMLFTPANQLRLHVMNRLSNHLVKDEKLPISGVYTIDFGDQLKLAHKPTTEVANRGVLVQTFTHQGLPLCKIYKIWPK